MNCEREECPYRTDIERNTEDIKELHRKYDKISDDTYDEIKEVRKDVSTLDKKVGILETKTDTVLELVQGINKTVTENITVLNKEKGVKWEKLKWLFLTIVVTGVVSYIVAAIISIL